MAAEHGPACRASPSRSKSGARPLQPRPTAGGRRCAAAAAWLQRSTPAGMHSCTQTAPSSSHLREAAALERAAQQEACKVQGRRLERGRHRRRQRRAGPGPPGPLQHKFFPCALTSPSGRQRGRRCPAAGAGSVAPRASGAPQAPPCRHCCCKPICNVTRCKGARDKHRAAGDLPGCSRGSAAGLRAVPGLARARCGQSSACL